MKRELLRRVVTLTLAALLAGSLSACGGMGASAPAPSIAEADAPRADGQKTGTEDRAAEEAGTADSTGGDTDETGTGTCEDLPDASAEIPPDVLWAAPTDLGLADTVWTTEDGWVMKLFYDASAPETSAASICRTDGGADARDGVWRMEGECLRLELDGGGAFPVLIAPSGETLRVFPGENGARPPFLNDTADFAEMTLTAG